MKNLIKKIGAVFLSLTVAASLLAGCGAKTTEPDASADKGAFRTLEEIKSSGTCPVRAKGYSWGDMVDIYGDGMTHSVMLYDKDKNVAYMRALTEGEGEIPETVPIQD